MCVPSLLIPSLPILRATPGLQDAAYLDREQDARDYSAHLAMFATRAHLSHQQQYNRADLNLMIMQASGAAAE